MSVLSLNNIHPEGLNQIAGFLELKDWNNMSRVNKPTFHVMQNLQNTSFAVNIVSDPDVLAITPESLKKIENVIIQGGRVTVKFDMESDPFALSAYLPHIEKIENLDEQTITYYGTDDALSRWTPGDPAVERVQKYLIALINQK